MTAPNRVGLAIDPNTNDLFLTVDNNLALARNAEAVGQHVRCRLMTFEKEWFLDNTAGVIWLSDILGKSYDPALAEAVVKGEIMDTEGVTEILSFSVGFYRDQRRLNLRSIEVKTDYDERVKI